MVGAICSLIVTGIQGATVDWPLLVELLEGLGGGAVILAVWAALGVFLATLFRSTALAVGFGLFYALALESLSSPCRSRTNPSRTPAGSSSDRTPAFSLTPSPEAPSNSPSCHRART